MQSRDTSQGQREEKDELDQPGAILFTRASYLDDRLRAKLLTWLTTSREHSSKEFITVYGGVLSSPALTHSNPALFRPRLKAAILLQLYATIQVGPA